MPYPQYPNAFIPQNEETTVANEPFQEDDQPTMVSEMQEIIDAFDDLKPKLITELTAEMARQQPKLRDAFLGVLQNHIITRTFKGLTIPIKEVKHVVIPRNGGEIIARVYNPDPENHLPVLLYFHGGGWVIGDLNTYDASCRAIAHEANCIVVSVAYRQAPEYPYPAAHEDAMTAYTWLLENSVSIGGKANLIAVGGESAGGNLAASVCLQARTKNLKQPIHQLLIYPVLDCDMGRTSYKINKDAKPLNKAMMEWFFKHYFGAIKFHDEVAFPLQANNLYSLAPATIITAEIDPLCSEGEVYAKNLQDAGVAVFSKRYNGVCHEFFGFSSYVPQAMDALEDAVTQLKEAFGTNKNTNDYTDYID